MLHAYSVCNIAMQIAQTEKELKLNQQPLPHFSPLPSHLLHHSVSFYIPMYVVPALNLYSLWESDAKLTGYLRKCKSLSRVIIKLY